MIIVDSNKKVFFNDTSIKILDQKILITVNETKLNISDEFKDVENIFIPTMFHNFTNESIIDT